MTDKTAFRFGLPPGARGSRGLRHPLPHRGRHPAPTEPAPVLRDCASGISPTRDCHDSYGRGDGICFLSLLKGALGTFQTVPFPGFGETDNPRLTFTPIYVISQWPHETLQRRSSVMMRQGQRWQLWELTFTEQPANQARGTGFCT